MALVRQALFNVIGDSIRGAWVLDLFAGAGTLGIEALSRGAERAMFVDRERSCVNIVTENLAATRFAPQGDVACAEAADWLKAHRGDLSRYHVILLDPPYHDPALEETLKALDAGALHARALVVVEHHKTDALPELIRLIPVQEKTYGTTRLTFLRAHS